MAGPPAGGPEEMGAMPGEAMPGAPGAAAGGAGAKRLVPLVRHPSATGPGSGPAVSGIPCVPGGGSERGTICP